MNYDHMTVEKEGSLCIITLNREERLNSVTIGMLEELIRAAEMVAEDSAMRALILTGKGRGFCSGADMELINALLSMNGVQFRRVLRDLVQRAVNSLENLELPVIAAVNGFATGGGVELALGCDFRIASEKAHFIFTEVKIGIIPDGGGIPRLTRLLGSGRAKELIMLGKSVDGREAERIGLVHKCVAPDQLLDEAKQWANQLAKCAPLAVGVAKRIIDMGMDVNLMTALDMTGIAQQELLCSIDFQEGIKAFTEKREPLFKGK
jgi:enoyl-CoA hydratase